MFSRLLHAFLVLIATILGQVSNFQGCANKNKQVFGLLSFSSFSVFLAVYLVLKSLLTLMDRNYFIGRSFFCDNDQVEKIGTITFLEIRYRRLLT